MNPDSRRGQLLSGKEQDRLILVAPKGTRPQDHLNVITVTPLLPWNET